MGETPFFALSLVLTAAILHAVWNALIKGASDRLLTLGLIASGHVMVGVALIVLYAPPAPAAWPYIAASTVIHFFYYWFLLNSYRLGDLSHVYPISRGIAPVLISLGAVLFAGENLAPAAWGAVFVVSFGIIILAWGGGRDGMGTKALGAALLTGTMIATYSVVDGIGVRVSGSPLGYIGWLFFFEIYVAGFILWRQRAKLSTLPARTWGLGVLGGLLSAAAYGLVIFAKNIAPFGAVSAVRESSVIVAALIGVLIFGERPWAKRLVAALIVVAGIVLLIIFS
ncbi:MAG: EamA family transporter [Alphaproteobacteria bacterium]|nr:EamA family transporter [Alphaproteobacteria bacterium]